MTYCVGGEVEVVDDVLAASNALYCSAIASASSSLTPGGFTVPERTTPPPRALEPLGDAVYEEEVEDAEGLKGPMLLALAADEDRAIAAIL